MIPAADRAVGAAMTAPSLVGVGLLLRLAVVCDPVTGSLCAVLAAMGAGVAAIAVDLASGLALTRALHRDPPR